MSVRSRNKSYKGQLGPIVIIGVIISCLFNVVLSRSANADSVLEENICTTSTCRDEAAKITERLDPKINPCDNFYEFVCGNMADFKQSDYSSLKSDLIELYMEPIRDDEHVMVKAEKRAFQGCVNLKNETSTMFSEFRNVIKTFGGWPILEGSSWDETKFDWLQTTYKLRELGLPFRGFLDLTVDQDPRNDSRYVLQVVSVQKSYFSNERSFRERTFLVDVETFAPFSNWKTEEVADMLDFESKLQDIGYQEFTLYTVEEFQKKYDSINWLEFINAISGPRAQISLQDSVLFPDVEFLRKKLDIISNTPKRTQANYLIWGAIDEFITRLRLQDVSLDNTADSCAYMGYLSLLPIEIMYARKYIPENKKRSIEILVKNMKNELIKLLNQVEWITEEEKQTINEQLLEMKVVLGTVGDYLDDKVLDDLNVNMEDVSNASLFTVLTQIEKNFKSLEYGNIHKTVIEVDLQKHIPSIIRPYAISYDSYSQVLALSTVAMLPMPWFNDNRPNYLNYGILGRAVGNKLSDNLIKEPFSPFIRYSAHYKFSNESENRFSTYKRCLDTDLEKHELSKNYFPVHISSKMIVGAKLSYNAYREWVKKNNKEEQKLVGIDYTPNQLFWISSVDCIRNPSSEKWLMRDYPSYYLPNLVVRNNAEFAQDFNCPVNSPMNPQERCFNF